MNLPNLKTRMTACLIALATAGTVHAGSTFYYDSTDVYRSIHDSPFTSFSESIAYAFFLEDFEDGLLNSPGLSVDVGGVRGPAKATDSVDADGDGIMDGLGNSGYSYNAGDELTMRLRFDASALGGLPTFFGFVWTDGRENSSLTFRAFDANGDLIHRIRIDGLGDGSREGTTRDDRFIGLESDGGIARIVLISSNIRFEMDHIQYGLASAVVPLPAPLALGLVGLGGVALAGRRRRAGL